MRKLVVVVDYDDVTYTSFFTSSKKLMYRWSPIINFLDLLRECVVASRKRFNSDDVYFIFAGESEEKLSENKGGPLDNLYYYIFRYILRFIIKDLGFEIAIDNRHRDVDILASIVNSICFNCKCEGKCDVCKCLEKSNMDVVIFSDDRNLEALLTHDEVTMFRSSGIFFTKEMFVGDYGFSPKYLPVYLALVGDIVNGIESVPRWGRERAIKHIIRNDVYDSLISEKHRELFEKNYLRTEFKCDLDISILPRKMSCGDDLFNEITVQKVIGEYPESLEDIYTHRRLLREAVE